LQKIEYGDINKFLVSIGLVLISLSVVSPYLYLTQDFGINIEKSKFEKLQEPAKNIILDKQEKVALLKNLFYVIPIILLLGGIICIWIGLSRWSKRQIKIDEKFDKEVDKLTIEIESLSPEEREEKAKEEIRQIQEEEKPERITTSKEVRSEVFREYIAVEESITQVFKNYNSKNFEVLAQQKLGNKFEVDIFLKAKSSEFADRIVEIKYFRKKISGAVINSALKQLSTYIKYYKSVTHKPVVPVLIVVYHMDKIGRIGLLELEASILGQRLNFANLRRLKAQFVEENQIDKFKVQDILKR
jgi:hypothetical protein